jgi:dCTP diphosphatase
MPAPQSRNIVPQLESSPGLSGRVPGARPFAGLTPSGRREIPPAASPGWPGSGGAIIVGRSCAGGESRRGFVKGLIVQRIIEDIRAFNRERDWDQYHSPKNLSMALAVETAELLEVFQWLTEEQSRHLPAAKQQAVEEEIGDVTILLLTLADHLGVDVLEAARQKLRRNETKYPAAKARGRAEKYNELE